jgi:hypothetical protein
LRDRRDGRAFSLLSTKTIYSRNLEAPRGLTLSARLPGASSKEDFMRHVLAGAIFASGIGFLALHATAAALGRPELRGETNVIQAQSLSYCARLNRRCENKDERGERGEGNCRRFREECGSLCVRLRRACERKDERGERGEGNCRRYREVCGSGRGRD